MCWALSLLYINRPSDQGTNTIQKEGYLEKSVDLSDNGVEVGHKFVYFGVCHTSQNQWLQEIRSRIQTANRT
jgi:hypothetical protein